MIAPTEFGRLIIEDATSLLKTNNQLRVRKKINNYYIISYVGKPPH